MFQKDGDKRSFSLTRSATVIGRKDDCDLRVPSEKVSRKHCRIVKDGDVVRLEDLGSSNGTYHNGHRINTSEILQAGDSIEIGPIVFVLQVDGVPADDELAPLLDRAAHKLEDELSAHPPMAPAADEEDEIHRLQEMDSLEPASEPELPADDQMDISLDDLSHEPLQLHDAELESHPTPPIQLHGEHEPLGLMELHDEHQAGENQNTGHEHSGNGAVELHEPNAPIELGPISLSSDEPLELINLEDSTPHDIHHDQGHGQTQDQSHGSTGHMLEDDLLLGLFHALDQPNTHN